MPFVTVIRSGSITDETNGTGTALPDASATPITHFLLTGQVDVALNGWYEKVGTTHWLQVTTGGNNSNETFGAGDALPNVATTGYLTFLLKGTGLFTNESTHWVQQI